MYSRSSLVIETSKSVSFPFALSRGGAGGGQRATDEKHKSEAHNSEAAPPTTARTPSDRQKRRWLLLVEAPHRAELISDESLLAKPFCTTKLIRESSEASRTTGAGDELVDSQAGCFSHSVAEWERETAEVPWPRYRRVVGRWVGVRLRHPVRPIVIAEWVPSSLSEKPGWQADLSDDSIIS